MLLYCALYKAPQKLHPGTAACASQGISVTKCPWMAPQPVLLSLRKLRTKELCQGNALPASVIFQQNSKWVFPRLGNQQQGLFSLRRFSLSLPCWSQGRGTHLLHEHAHRLCLWGTYFNLTLIFYIMPNITELWEFISVHFMSLVTNSHHIWDAVGSKSQS